MKSLKQCIGHPAFTLPVSGALLAFAGALVFTHAVTIRQVKEIGLPAATVLPQMEERLAILSDQLEAAELQEALRTGSAAEQLRVHVLPEKLNLDRLLATFDLLRDAFQQDRLLFSLSPIRVGEPTAMPNHEGLRAVPVSLEAEVSQEGMDKLLLLFRLSGAMTVSDTFTPAELSALINLTEQENPAALTVLEQFLAIDLLQYAKDPGAFEAQVLRSLTSESFEQKLTELLRHSMLAKARYLYGGSVGALLEAHNLWPAQMMGIRSVEAVPLSGDHLKLKLVLEAYVRS